MNAQEAYEKNMEEYHREVERVMKQRKDIDEEYVREKERVDRERERIMKLRKERDERIRAREDKRGDDKDARIQDLSHKLDTCSSEKESLRVEISDLGSGMDSMIKQLSKCNSSSETQKVRIAAVDQLVEELNAKIQLIKMKFDNEKTELEMKIIKLTQLIEDMNNGENPESEGFQGFNCVKRWNVRGSSTADKLKSCEMTVSNEPIDNVTRFRGKQNCVVACNEDQG